MTEQQNFNNGIFYQNEYKNIRIKLQNEDLWEKFYSVNNEMIITKAGRKMFPIVELIIGGLDQNAIYDVYLEFIPVDNNRWKYVNGDWLASGKSTNKIDPITYKHPESPNFGKHWMSKEISFDKIKLTNKSNQEGHVVLNSLHRYKTVVHVIYLPFNKEYHKKTVETCDLAITTFFAVTAYQNEELKSLKIQYNPYAKSFIKNNLNRKIFEEECITEKMFTPLVMDIAPELQDTSTTYNAAPSPTASSANSSIDSDVNSEESNYSMPSPHYIERPAISDGNSRFNSTPAYQFHASLMNPYENNRQHYPYNQEVLTSNPYWHYFCNPTINSQYPYQQISSQEQNTYYQPIDYTLLS